MSIASELTNLEGNIEDSYDAVNDMGGIIPAQRNMDNLDQAIRTIPQNQGTTYTAGYGIDIDQNDEISVDTTVIAEKTDIPTATSDLTNDSGFITSADLPTKTSDLTNDGSDGNSTYVEADDLATVATSGSYNDLSNTPTIPAAQVNSDWNALSGVAQILNKPSLATVATSGAYSDLTGTPTIPTNTSDLVNDGSDGTSTYVEADGLAAVATSGDYDDLLNKPTIPAAQIQSDWTQATTTALDYIKNKPSLATVATSGSYNDLSNKPTIPTVNNATLTIQKNGTTVKTFTANSSTNVTANITVPTVTSTSTQLDVGSWHFWFFSFSNSASGWTTKDITHPTAFRGHVKHVGCNGLWGNSGDNRLGAWLEYNNNTVLRLRVYQGSAGSNAFFGVAIAYY